MARCEVCGNDYDKSFEVVIEGTTHVFDCAHCAREAGVGGAADRV